jgi:GTP-binding protein
MFPMLEHVPIAFITAQKGKNTLRLLQLAVQLHKQAGVRVSTGDLNRAIRDAIEASPPPMAGNRQPKVFYATQIGVHPPTVVLFTNGPELFDDTYVRYLTKSLRDTFPFSEVAIKVVLRAKGEKKNRDPDTEEIEVTLEEGDDSAEIFRASKEHPPLPPPEEDEPDQRPRKKPRGSETWDF